MALYNSVYYYFFKPWYSVPRVDQKIKYKEMKLEWLLIRPILNTKTVVQQDSVKALHVCENVMFPVVSAGTRPEYHVRGGA